MLGAARDTENDGVPSAMADGDGADEDGVSFSTLRVGQTDASVAVNVQDAPKGARLDAWIDFDGDSAWGSAGEQIFDSVRVVEGVNLLQFDAPSWGKSGDRVARFRLSIGGDLGVAGSALDGEVEDHLVSVDAPAAASAQFSGENVIDGSALDPFSVYAADFDGDGDMDVVSASFRDDTIAWFENDGNEAFSRHTISTAADRCAGASLQPTLMAMGTLTCSACRATTTRSLGMRTTVVGLSHRTLFRPLRMVRSAFRPPTWTATATWTF